jgi:hypothetical protein
MLYTYNDLQSSDSSDICNLSTMDFNVPSLLLADAVILEASGPPLENFEFLSYVTANNHQSSFSDITHFAIV